MKNLSAFFTMLLLLFVSVSCEDEDSNVSLFSGVEPIYQTGTCNNLVSSLTFYLTDSETTVLGLDGGDGYYRLFNEQESVASVSFADEVNGYQRISIQPLAAGRTTLKVVDGSGTVARLNIVVKSRREYKLVKTAFEYGISVGYIDLLPDVTQALDGRAWLEVGGYYQLVPDADCSFPLEKGDLEIYPTGQEDEPLTGRYETVPLEGGEDDAEGIWQFTDANGERYYYRTLTTDTDSDQRLTLAEDITSFCPAGMVPSGVIVVYRETFRMVE
ncbi:MAG: hypothetical protein Q4D56_09720 [Bacteroides sp.]|nr:hypothetical protein [Bacteroides sp.]